MLLKHSDEEYKSHVGMLNKYLNMAKINVDKDIKKFCHNCKRVVDSIHNEPPNCAAVQRSHPNPREDTGEKTEAGFIVRNWTYGCCHRVGSSCTEVENPSHAVDFFDPPGCALKVKKFPAHAFE